MDIDHAHRLPLALAASLAPLVSGCVSEAREFEGDNQERAIEVDVVEDNDACTVTRGDLYGSHRAVHADVLLSCPDIKHMHKPQVGLEPGALWGSFGDGQGADFRVAQDGVNFSLDWLSDLPGTDFTGQAPDGRLYRYANNYSGYIYNDGDAWLQAPVDLPSNLSAYFGFHLHPDGEGELHGQFHTGLANGDIQYASLEGGEWSWDVAGKWGGVSGPYAGTDAWDRDFTMRFDLSFGGEALWLLDLDGDTEVPVGAPDADPGFLANPPRPALGGDAPIAVLRRIPGDALHLLSVVDADDWSESPVPDTPEAPEMCDELFAHGVPACPPCEVQGAGVEFDAYELVRTSGGQLWGLWVKSDFDVEYVYEVNQLNATKWQCKADLDASSPYADATLVLAELEADGSVARSLELDLGQVWVDDSARRKINATAYGEDIGVIVQVDTAETGTDARVLRIDTEAI
ncbi:hypothetical protein PPSIR1_02071 [Plesiocystis pacifica SIR-1]|uniref:Uncharacterized protein n=1 Tax=Plesiocystis pacifica SIR-1 TaxID=391625 RepID=A6GIN5_9BACT|nr:hypothetical protein [Plesiocystis pacifica]EDM74284.1 hypothetical protein PPSIR1_02071 [Plesiocystis pacifica SIR-1]